MSKKRLGKFLSVFLTSFIIFGFIVFSFNFVLGSNQLKNTPVIRSSDSLQNKAVNNSNDPSNLKNVNVPKETINNIITKIISVVNSKSLKKSGSSQGSLTPAANSSSQTNTTSQPDTCSDSDGGVIPEIFGNASGFLNQTSYSYSDYCINNATLMEYYCYSNNHAYSINLSCDATSICSSGACLTAPTNDTNVTLPPTNNASCVDSDDGLNYYSFGYISWLGKNYGQYLDYCIGSTLYEATCTNVTEDNFYHGINLWQPYACQDGCNNGACLNSTLINQNSCTDTDGGLNYFVSGNISWIGANTGYTDYCANSTLLKETSCIGVNSSMFINRIGIFQDHYCLNGCINGACLPENNTQPPTNDTNVTLPPTNNASCVDSDGGLNYNLFGSISWSAAAPGTYSDYCIGSTLYEAKCDNITEYQFLHGFNLWQPYACQDGCNNGVCLSASTNATLDDDPPISNCQNINYSGTFVLTQNLYSNNTCITISADNVTLDGQGHSIIYVKDNTVSNPFSYGIKIDGKSNLILRNITINGFNENIDIYNSNNDILTNVNADYSSNCGILLLWSTNNSITSTKARYASNVGICLLSDSNKNILTNVDVTGGHSGVYLQLANNNILTGINANPSYDCMVSVYQSYGNTFNNIIPSQICNQV